MLDFKVDLGQIVIVTFIAIIGWFAKREITTHAERIDRIEESVNDKFEKQNEIIFNLAGNIQKLMGMFQFTGRKQQ